MDILKAINQRFSCRSYINKKISDSDIHKIIECGIKAPNSGNLQCWRFIVVDEKEKKEELVKASLNQRWMMQAPILIAVCGDLKNELRFYNEKGGDYLIHDCSAAIENMLLCATSLKIKSCWVGAIDKKAVQRVLRLEEHIIPVAIITLGYSKEKAGNKKRHMLDTFVYYNEYGNKDNGKGLFPLGKHFGKK